MDIGNQNVFVPSVVRSSFSLKNNLYDIIQKDVAKPVASNEEVLDTCNFTPKNGKLYVSKKKSRFKVITVGDVRQHFEKDIFETLPYELEKQQKLLLKKIRDGFSKDKNTKNIALNLLKSDKPISKTSWQMLMNLNPECHSHSSQFVLWNGKCIQVNGSRGGKNKFICHYDLSKVQKAFKKDIFSKNKVLKNRRILLRDSLNIKFKPGPLCKKVELDNSYQKYHGGKIEVIDLPRPGLFLKPSYGTVLEPMVIKSITHNSRQEDGTISEKWAEFAASVIGKVTKKGVEIEADNTVAFDINYKYNQKRFLMRHDVDTVGDTFKDIVSSSEKCTKFHDSGLMSEVKNVLDKIIDSVEISLNQNLLYSGADERREILPIESTRAAGKLVKEKSKRKYCELDRLDVTVITLTDKRRKNCVEPCRELHCSLGCVCDSLDRGNILKDHCGEIDCMLGCKCDFSKYKIADTLDGDCSELLPGLFHLDKKLNDKLSKEEQKFHQTVIVTDDKSILLKSKRRNWKTSKKYAEFYSNMHLRTDIKNNRFLCIAIPKLKCDNIEPWCMVHNLYKCFCKGQFTQSFVNNFAQMEKPNTNDESNKEKDSLSIVNLTETNLKDTDVTAVPNIIPLNEQSNLSNFDCARITPFAGRKFSNGYYLRTNEKIIEMEKNDMKLQKKMLNLMKKSYETEQTNDYKEQNNIINNVDGSVKPQFGLDDLLKNILHEQEKLMDNGDESRENTRIEEIKRLPNKTKLVEWIETSYKKYKEIVDKGLWKTVLNPPRIGKVALYPWSFILSRYQEQKNLFLISKDKPYRIFMAVNAKHNFFENCINIRYIRQSHINDYPITVRNLINNVQNLKDNFCILCGLSLCWELVGSVSKLDENKIDEPDSDTNQNITIVSESSKNSDCLPNTTSYIEPAATSVISNTNINDHQELSRWFVMAIEDDVTEIQFFIKGFFVKYTSIVKAIHVARKVGKTVRLSSQRCSDGGDGPQFGIYATPNMNENSVFVGPYDKNEPLGIETLKNPVQAVNQKKTRGLWIAIKKENNAKVLENPLCFMPSFKKNSDKVIILDNNLLIDMNKNEQQKLKENSSQKISSCENDRSPTKRKNQPIKTVKPIKIRKTDGFYHLAPQSLLKKLPIRKCTYQKNENIEKVRLSSSKGLPNRISPSTKIKSLRLENSNTELNSVFNKPVAEIAPQIKISNITSLCNNTSSNDDYVRNKKSEKGMFVLKPEEINNRLISNYFHVMQRGDCENVKNSTVVSNKDTELNVEEFLESSSVRTPPDTDTYIISDDEDDFSNVPDSWRKVWITCTNIKSIGWIQGRRNNENKLSFEFPGFEYTNFYEEEEAFKKINEVLSRKIYVPKKIYVKWRVIENEEELNVDRKLQLEDLGVDIVLSKEGLVHKNFFKTESMIQNKDLKGDAAAVASTSTEFGEINVVISKEEIIADDTSEEM